MNIEQAQSIVAGILQSWIRSQRITPTATGDVQIIKATRDDVAAIEQAWSKIVEALPEGDDDDVRRTDQ